MKECPYCSEKIQSSAKKCRYCGEWLDDDAASGGGMTQADLNITISDANNKLHEGFLELVESEIYGGWGPTKLQKMIKKERGWILPGSNPEESSRLTQAVFNLCGTGVGCGLYKSSLLLKDKTKIRFINLMQEDWSENFAWRSNPAYQKYELIDPFDEPIFFGKNVKKYLDIEALNISGEKYIKIFGATLKKKNNEKYEVSDVFIDSCGFNPIFNTELKKHINELFAKSIILPIIHLKKIGM